MEPLQFELSYGYQSIEAYFDGRNLRKLQRLIEEVATKNNIEILSLSIQPDHVHLFISAPPRYSPAQLINLFKGYTAKGLLERFPPGGILKNVKMCDANDQDTSACTLEQASLRTECGFCTAV